MDALLVLSTSDATAPAPLWYCTGATGIAHAGFGVAAAMLDHAAGWWGWALILPGLAAWMALEAVQIMRGGPLWDTALDLGLGLAGGLAFFAAVAIREWRLA